MPPSGLERPRLMAQASKDLLGYLPFRYEDRIQQAVQTPYSSNDSFGCSNPGKNTSRCKLRRSSFAR